MKLTPTNMSGTDMLLCIIAMMLAGNFGYDLIAVCMIGLLFWDSYHKLKN